MAKPDFLVIGAQKAGTTWLDKMFKSHPDIWTPVVKELQFFNSLYMPEAFQWTHAHRQSHAVKGIEYASLLTRSILESSPLLFSLGGRSRRFFHTNRKLHLLVRLCVRIA